MILSKADRRVTFAIFCASSIDPIGGHIVSSDSSLSAFFAAFFEAAFFGAAFFGAAFFGAAFLAAFFGAFLAASSNGSSMISLSSALESSTTPNMVSIMSSRASSRLSCIFCSMSE